MATVVWTGKAQAVAQVSTITVTTVADTNTFTVTVGGKTVTVTADGSSTTSTIAAALKALLAASTIPEISEATWTVDDAVITGTGKTKGIPFTADGSTVGGAISDAVATAASGPQHWGVTANWSTGVVPVATDSVYIDDANANIGHSLPDDGRVFAAVELRAGAVGLPRQNAGGYPEYRTQRAVFGATAMTIGTQNTGPSLVRIDLGDEPAAVVVRGATSNTDGASIDLLMNDVASTVTVLGGSVDIAAAPGETAVLATVNVGPSGTVALGSGVTVVTVNASGALSIVCGATTLNVESGRVELSGSAAITTLEIRDGTVNHQTTGTITTANVGPGVLNMGNDVRARTITNCTLRSGGVIDDPFSAAVFTNGVQMDSAADQLSAR